MTSLPIHEFSGRLLDCYAPPLRAAATQSKMRATLAALIRCTEVETTADLTTSRLARYITARAREVCLGTLDGELGYLAAACAYAVQEGWLDRSPFESRRLRVRPGPPERKQHHPMADLVRVLEHLRSHCGDSWEAHRLYAAASTVAYTGLRRSEALCLMVEDVVLEDGVICVVARRRLKTVGSAAPVPIPPRLGEVLAVWLPQSGPVWLFPNRARTGPWVGGNPGYKPLDRLKQAGRAVGVEGLTWQSLRHSWATHAEGRWGLGEAAIQRVLRHTRPMTQRLYRHADLANLRRIGESVSYVP